MFSRLREENGAVAVLTAVVLLALMAASAVAVDVGRLAVVSRDQQGATDRAALDALLAFMEDPGSLPMMCAAAESSLGRNAGFSGRISDAPWQLDCEAGDVVPVRWDRDAGGPTAGDPNAVQITTRSSVSSLFLPSSDATAVTRTATAMVTDPVGAISVRTSTARLDHGLLNAIAEDVGIDLGLVAYDGVATPTVRLGDVLAVDGEAGTVEELLGLQVNASDLAGAWLGLLAVDGDDVGMSAELLDALTVIDEKLNLPRVSLDEILNVTTESASEALDARVDVLALISASAQAAARDHAIATGAGIPLAGAGGVSNVELTVVEPERIAIGPADGSTVAESAQMELSLTLDLAYLGEAGGPIQEAIDSVVDALLDAVDSLLELVTCVLGYCSGAEVDLRTVDVNLALAQATAPLSTLSCPEGHDPDEPLVVEASSDPVQVTAARLGIDGPLLGLSGSDVDDGVLDVNSVQIGGSTSSVDLSGEVPTDPRKQVTSGTSVSVGQSDLIGTGTIGEDDVLSELPSPVTDLLNEALLDDGAIVDTVLDELGLSLGIAEVALVDGTCGRGRVLVE